MKELERQPRKQRLGPERAVDSLPVAQLRQDSPSLIVVEKESMAKRAATQSNKLLLGVFALIIVSGIAFGLGFLIGSQHTLEQLKPHLQDGVSIRRGFSPWLLGPSRNQTDFSVENHLEGEVSNEAFASNGSESNSPGEITRPIPIKPKEHTEHIQGSITKPAPIPLGVQKSGWGNAFELVTVTAQEGGTRNEKLLYLWKLSVRNLRNRNVTVDITTELKDREGKKTLGSVKSRSTLLALETKVVEGEMLIDQEKKNDVGSIEAVVRTPF